MLKNTTYDRDGIVGKLLYFSCKKPFTQRMHIMCSRWGNREPPVNGENTVVPLCGQLLYIFGHTAITEDENCRAMSVFSSFSSLIEYKTAIWLNCAIIHI